MGHIGKRAVACLREPSLGPVFGIKGGAAGGGMTQIVPMEDLNLHFTGDIHAIGAANNLLAAMLDASILHGNPHKVDQLRVGWRRALDMNDRALREITIGQGGRANGYPRESGFDITAASEVMAILAVAKDLQDLRARLGRITVAQSFDGGKPITAEDLGAAGAMAVLLKDAIKPNLVQTLEGQPCLMHCGPFANIAHGNNSLIADQVGMKIADYVITESGFGSDMGMEKFFDIVCRFGKLTPSAVVLVTTVRAIKHHGNVEEQPGIGRSSALRAIEVGMANVRRHLGIIGQFGMPAVVAVNRRPGDTNEEIELVKRLALEAGAAGAEANEGFTHGGAGAAALARAVVEACEQPNDFRLLYDDDEPIQDKIEAVAKRVYGAGDVYFYPEAEKKLTQFTDDGLAHFPVCMAKTHLSLTSDPTMLNAPEHFTLPVRDIRAYTGAGWLVPLCGDITQMPGLGKQPAALNVDIDPDGRTVGLF
jgi:formate--tetrahydrofolate ligase